MNTAPAPRIVLIDDEPGVLRALTLVLQTMGYEVLAFSAPQEALTYLRAGIDADLVLSDQRMPGMVGTELFRTLRTLSINAPFVLMSGHAQEAEVLDILRAPSTAFLPKPFTPVTLKEALDMALPGGAKARAS